MKTILLATMAILSLGLGACSNQAKLEENVNKANALSAAINAYYAAQKPAVVVEDTK